MFVRLAVLLIAMLLSPLAYGQAVGIGGAGMTCPYGYTNNDGCPQAPVGASVQYPTAFTTYAQSGQTLARPTGFNVPGIDYPVGTTKPLSGMSDPATATFPNTCTYTASSSLVNNQPYVVCTFSGSSTCPDLATVGNCYEISNMNFAAGVGGHGCTTLNVTSVPAGATVLLDNINVDANDANCSGLFGVPISFVITSTPYNEVILSSTFNGEELNQQLANPRVATALSLSGCVIIEYTAFIEYPGRTFAHAGLPSCGVDLLNNVFFNNGFRSNLGHFEYIVENPTVAVGYVNYQYNTSIMTNNGSPGGGESDFLSTLKNFVTGNSIMNGNVFISNCVGGANTPVPCGSTGFTGSVSGSEMTVATATGNLGPGQEFSVSGPITASISGTTLTCTAGCTNINSDSSSGNNSTLITGTGVTSGTYTTAPLGGNQWTVNNSQIVGSESMTAEPGLMSIVSNVSGCCGTGSVWNVDWENVEQTHDGFAGNYSQSFSFTVATAAAQEPPAYRSGTTAVNGVYIFTDNYLDMSAMDSGLAWFLTESPPCPTVTFSGNVDMSGTYNSSYMNNWTGGTCG